MRLFDLIAILIVLAAIFSYMNVRLLRLPATIGLMASVTGLFRRRGRARHSWSRPWDSRRKPSSSSSSLAKHSRTACSVFCSLPAHCTLISAT